MEITVWIAAIVVFLIVEALTPSLVSIWFATGSLTALAVAVFGGNIYLQLIVFLVVSALCVLFIRKYYKKTLTDKNLPDISERFIGTKIIVLEEVDNLREKGLAKISGVQWRLKSENGDVISEGERVIVTALEGVKLVVKKCDL